MVPKLLDKLSLRTVLIVPFVLQIVGAVGLVGYLSFINGQKAVNNLAGQLMSEVSLRVEQNLQTYLTTPHQINQSKLDAVKLGFLKMENLSAWENTLDGKYNYIPISILLLLATRMEIIDPENNCLTAPELLM